MNIVFLDIDGVLNNMGSVVGLGNPSRFFDPVSVALVDKLCREGDARIVISSSWRRGKPKPLANEITKAGGGVLAERIFGETPYLGVERGKEIERWLAGAGDSVERYVILDDDGDMLEGQPFVQTKFEDGFRFRHYIAALKYLKPEHPDCRDRAIIVPESGE